MAPCPCGSGTAYAGCCGPVHDGAPATTAEALMRSRYTAYVVGHVGHLLRSWHPRTRPADLELPSTTWTGLEVLRTEAGGPDDGTGTVEFRAHHRDGSGDHVLHEVSSFERRGGRWVYVAALVQRGRIGPGRDGAQT